MHYVQVVLDILRKVLYIKGSGCLKKLRDYSCWIRKCEDENGIQNLINLEMCEAVFEGVIVERKTIIER